jgi:hypothetical protein
MQEAIWDRAKLDHAIVVLVHQLVAVERINRLRISAGNKRCVRGDSDAIGHLLEFAEHAIRELGIDHAAMDGPAKAPNRLHVRPAIPSSHSKSRSRAAKPGQLSLPGFFGRLRGNRRGDATDGARDSVH